MNPLESDKSMDRVVPELLKKAGIRTRHWETVPLQGGNNRVYKLMTDQRPYVLKQYFFSETEGRNRLSSEFNFLEYIWKNGVRNIAEPVFCDLPAHMALYGYIEGKKTGAQGIEKHHVIKAMDFIETINVKPESGADPWAEGIGMASDYSLRIEEYSASVDNRINRLQSVGKETLQEAGGFVFDKLIPQWKRIMAEVMELKGEDNILLKEDMILSPSDFGFHNTVIGKNEEIFFIDFEYAGWDDPAKLICDFFCQPEIPVPPAYMDYCMGRMAGIVHSSVDLHGKIDLLMPLFRIKWCCIMLNDFLPVDSGRRQFVFFRENRRESRLKKAMAYFDRHIVKVFVDG